MKIIELPGGVMETIALSSDDPVTVTTSASVTVEAAELERLRVENAAMSAAIQAAGVNPQWIKDIANENQLFRAQLHDQVDKEEWLNQIKRLAAERADLAGKLEWLGAQFSVVIRERDDLAAKLKNALKWQKDAAEFLTKERTWSGDDFEFVLGLMADVPDATGQPASSGR